MEKAGQNAKQVRKVAVLGAESTGKTWLCERLAKHYSTVWVPEYAREYFHDSDIYNFTLKDLVAIAEKQLSMEEQFLPHANKLLFCDTTLITLKIWAELEFHDCPAAILEKLQVSRYDLYLVTENDLAWEEDPLRQNKHSRELLKQMNIKEIENAGGRFALISGSDDQRLSAAVRAINEFLFPG